MRVEDFRRRLDGVACIMTLTAHQPQRSYGKYLRFVTSTPRHCQVQFDARPSLRLVTCKSSDNQSVAPTHLPLAALLAVPRPDRAQCKIAQGRRRGIFQLRKDEGIDAGPASFNPR